MLGSLNGQKFLIMLLGMNKKDHYRQQRSYFQKEFSEIHEYSLSEWQKSYIERIKKYVLDNNFKEKTLLDIATGSGYVAIEMAKLGMQVIACDLTPKAIENLQKYKKRFSLSNLQLIVSTAEKIPLKDNSVDYIVANAILEHIPNEEEAIAEWKRILKTNGKMFITVPLRFRFIWPFLWPINYLHDKRIGHLRRYDLPTLHNKFKLKLLHYFYTGHLVKVFGIIVSILLKTNKFEKYFERKDSAKEYVRYGANNVTVIFKNI